MNRRWPAAMFALLGFAPGISKEQRDSERQPASPFLFEWKQPRTPCDPVPTSGAYLNVRIGTMPNAVHRLDESVLSREKFPALRVSAQSALVRVEGSDRSDYLARFCAEVGARTENEAKQLLDQMRLTTEEQTLTLKRPERSTDKHVRADLRIQAPADAPVILHGDYAALAVRGINAPVKLTTTHARITVLDITGDVDATAMEFGIIDFSASQGRVRLQAATEINIKFPTNRFEGTLEAVAERPVRVLLPPGFTSGFAATVENADDFICRADICGEIKKSKRDGHFVFMYGSAEPQIRLRSLHGPVVISN